MQRTCDKCGHVNTLRPDSAVCPKCMHFYGSHARAASATTRTFGRRLLNVAKVGLLSLAVFWVAMTITSRMAENDVQAQRQDTTSAEQAEANRIALVEQAVGEGRVFIGMRAADVRRAWGEPTRINTTIRQSGTDEQWVYRHLGGSDKFVYLSNGIVRTIQDMH